MNNTSLIEAAKWAVANCEILAHNVGRVDETVVKEILTGIADKARKALTDIGEAP